MLHSLIFPHDREVGQSSGWLKSARDRDRSRILLSDSSMLLASHRPDFLVISPPKTGTTWLADNLRCHPQIFVPDIKEIKYFSSLLKWLDLEWYQSHFLAGSDRILGLALAAEPKQSTEFITSFVETNGSVWKW